MVGITRSKVIQYFSIFSRITCIRNSNRQRTCEGLAHLAHSIVVKYQPHAVGKSKANNPTCWCCMWKISFVKLNAASKSSLSHGARTGIYREKECSCGVWNTALQNENIIVCSMKHQGPPQCSCVPGCMASQNGMGSGKSCLSQVSAIPIGTGADV